MLATKKCPFRKSSSFWKELSIWVLSFIVAAVPIITFAKRRWNPLMHSCSRVYEQIFSIENYDYLPLYRDDFVFEGSLGQKIFCKKEHHSPEMVHLLKHYKDIELHTLQEHRGILTRDFTINGIRYVIKSSRNVGIVRNLLHMSRAVNIFNNGIWANEAGVDVLKPIALVENRGFRICDGAVVYLYEGKTLGHLLPSRPDLFKKMDELIKCMIDKSVIHHDLHIYNMVELSDGRIQLIDIDKLHRYPYASYGFYKRMEREIRKFNKRVIQDTVCTERIQTI